jgi:hypothetical protein
MKFRFLAASVFFLFPAVALAQDNPSFSKDVQPFLKKYCMECHRSGKVKGGLNLESYASIMKGSKRGRKVVIPGQPDQSRLVRTIEHQMKPYMPPRNSAQPREKDVAMLRAWIKAGAKNDSANSALENSTKIPLAVSRPQLDAAAGRMLRARNVDGILPSQSW